MDSIMDWLLKLFGLTTRQALFERIAVLENQCDHYTWVNQQYDKRRKVSDDALA